ncbi:hypothetical protein [Streptomyces sp. NPDC057623]|uniref:hypothetical protein n=1 Tax=Streptomyces sp. NPDC057623 TaxID=3346187 RepID=UPI00369A2228
MLATVAAVTPVSAAQKAFASEGVDLSESERAQEQAAESGEQVEVVGERTERETVFANPGRQDVHASEVDCAGASGEA